MIYIHIDFKRKCIFLWKNVVVSSSEIKHLKARKKLFVYNTRSLLIDFYFQCVTFKKWG